MSSIVFKKFKVYSAVTRKYNAFKIIVLFNLCINYVTQIRSYFHNIQQKKSVKYRYVNIKYICDY